MKYVDEFRNKRLIQKVAERIREIAPQEAINIMEVCGTHTQNFFRFGLDKLLPEKINFISGPGCPVCVSSPEYLDAAVSLSRDEDNIILTFGDMLRVPGSRSTLEKERASGADVRMVYSALEALKVARQNPRKKIIFLAVGFETTAPTIALSILYAKKEKLKNVFFFSSLKLIPPAMDYLLQDARLKLSGFLCPGHVSAIIGSQAYNFIPKEYGIACAVAGFEPLDILEGIYLLLQQIVKEKPLVANQYLRVVEKAGNPKAKKIIAQVFKVTDTAWRGLGEIPHSGLKIKEEFAALDAEKIFPLSVKQCALSAKQKKCRCGEVLKGLIRPDACALFRKVCAPENPLGPCMISREGACNAYYKYR